MPFRKYISHILNNYPIYVVIFCVQAPLSVLQIFISFYGKIDVIPTIFFLSFFSLFLFFIFNRIWRSPQLSGLATLTSLALLFPNAAITVPAYLIIVVAGIGFVVLKIWRRREKTVREAIRLPANFTYAANIVAVAMILAVGAQQGYFDYKIQAKARSVSAKTYATIGNAVTARPSGALPNIVHIVLDGYSRADVLQSVYHFDNSTFLDALRRRGFRIAEKATTPYNQTLLVMSSIFALRPVTRFVAATIKHEDMDTTRRMLAQSVQNSAVFKVLSDLGYDLRSTPSAYLPLQWNKIVKADGHPAAIEHFGLPGTYVFSYDLLHGSPIFRSLSEQLFRDSFSVAAVNRQNLSNVPKRRFRPTGNRPLFIYQHIIAPHPPFDITADGKPRVFPDVPRGLSDGSDFFLGDKGKQALYRQGYVDKLRYINKAVLTQIDRLKKALPGPLIIIIHGDHGGGLHFDQYNKSDTCVHERFSPLLAVYGTDPAVSSQFSDDFNIINMYRAIFRALLKVDLPNLPDRSTFINWNLDQPSVIDPRELDTPCETANGVWTARETSFPDEDPPAHSIAR